MIYNEEDNLTNNVGSKEREDVRLIPYKTHESVIKDGITFLKTKDHGEVAIEIFGKHNLQNISAALEVVQLIGISQADFYKAIATFKGAKNRLERLAENNGHVVFKDYAHSPSKLEATVKALKNQYGNKLAIAYELHTFSSLNKDFISEYKGTLDEADEAFVFINPHNLKVDDADTLKEKDIQQAFDNEKLRLFTTVEDLTAAIEAAETEGVKTFAFLSSGKFNQMDIKGLAQKLVS